MKRRAGSGPLIRHTCAVAFRDSDVEKNESGVPVAFRMWRAGVNRTDHGDHVFTDESARELLEAQASRGNRYSIDVDHMSLNEKAPPENHKAVGWFDVAVRDGDLWAVNVEWTDAVRAGLSAAVPEWKYFSPAYDTKKKSGEIVRLLNMALTNNPATHHVTALASMATNKETAMADDDTKKEESLGAMLAAFESEGDEEKRCAMKEAIRAKFKAAFPDDSDDKKDEPKKDEKKETKSAKAAEEPAEKKESTKASADDDEKKAESIAASVIAKIDAHRKAEDEKGEITKILSSLPAGDRKTYEGLGLEPLRRIVARHHSDVVTQLAAAGSVSFTRGDDAKETKASMLPVAARDELDRQMGFVKPAPFVEENGTTMSFNPHATPEDAEKFLASFAAEQAKSKTTGEALSRIFANQKGSAR